jgi:hypothetical protein
MMRPLSRRQDSNLPKKFVAMGLLMMSMGAPEPAGAGASPVVLTDDMRAIYANIFGDTVPTQTLRSLQSEARNLIASGDIDGGGLSRRDIELARNIANATVGADRVRSYFYGDLNGDGVLTLEEYKTLLRRADVMEFYARYEQARARGSVPPSKVTGERDREDGSLVQMFKAMDADHDGRLTLQEVFRYEVLAAYRAAETPVDAEKYLVLDANGDGTVTMDEVDATSAAFMAEQSLAGVGPRVDRATASDEEDEPQPRLEDAVRCPVPASSSTARIVRLGAREGGQLSSVAVGGQNVPTFVVRVEVEPGTEPLYIVATSDHPTIWRFSGATQRVQAFVGSSRARDAKFMWPAVGVIGIPKALFRTVPYACFGDFDEGNMRSQQKTSAAAQLVMRRLGRPIDTAFGAYQPQGVKLPSASPFKVPTEVPALFRNLRNESAAREWQGVLVHFPGGIAEASPGVIVSMGDPQTFEVYPYRAGLAQLLELGAIEPVSGVSDYRILRPIRFPSGLNGGFSETFRLPPDVPRPVGSPGHSRVLLDADPSLCIIGCR